MAATTKAFTASADARRHQRYKWPALRVVLKGRICQILDCSLSGFNVSGYYEGTAGEEVTGVIAHVDWGAKSRLDFQARIVRVNAESGEAAGEFIGLKNHEFDLLMSLLADTPDGEAAAGPLITPPEPDPATLPRELPPVPKKRVVLLSKFVDSVATGVSILAIVILVLAIGAFAISTLTDLVTVGSGGEPARRDNVEMRALFDSLSSRGTTPGAGR
jgi:hypothetical protein